MKKILLLFVFLAFSIDGFLYADELKCKKFDLKCKSKKLINETKDFQKKGIEKSKKQILKNKEQIKKTMMEKTTIQKRVKD